MNRIKGKFIVFEGLDGSGKFTQAKLLAKYLKKKGHKVAMIDFPQYGEKSAGLVENYLTGKYGDIQEVTPYVTSIFYAVDRYDASFRIRKWLKEGKIVISDRYVVSNIGYQGGKIKNKEQREKFIKWLYNLEYNIFGIPKPDIVFILKTSPGLARKMAPRITDKEKKKKRITYLGRRKRDIHEEDLECLSNALNSYLEVAKKFPKDFIIINCMKNNKLLPPLEIHKIILKNLEQK